MSTTDTLGQRLNPCLKELNLSTVRACYQEQAALARRESLSYEHYLLEILERERETRHRNRIARLLRESKLPLEKTASACRAPSMPTSACWSKAASPVGGRMSWPSAIPAAARRTCSVPWPKN